MKLINISPPGQCKGAMNPCANDAECVDLPDRKFECVCPEFYTGQCLLELSITITDNL